MWTRFFRPRPHTAGRRPRRSRPVLEALEARLTPSQIFWDSGTGGSWQDPANWVDDSSPPVHRLPGPGDDAFVFYPASTFTVTFDGDATVRALACNHPLEMDGGTLTILGSGPASQIVGLDLRAPATLRQADGGLALAGAVTLAGTLDAAAPTATVVLAPDNVPAAIDIRADAYPLLPGPGLYVLAPGRALNVNVPYTLPDNFELDGTLVANAVTTAGATFLLRGTQRGDAPFVVPDGSVMTWGNSAGPPTTIGPGTLEVQPGGTMNIANAGGGNLSNAVLNNAGTVLVTAAATVQFVTNSTINNLGGGVFDFEADNRVTFFSGANAFNNAGVVLKTGGAGTTDLALPFNNAGWVEVGVGTLRVQSGTSSGTFQADDGGTVEFIAHTLAEGAALPGPGLFRVRGAVALNADLAVGRLELSSPDSVPVLTVAGSLTVTDTLDFRRGTTQGSGLLTIADGAAMTVAGGGTTLTVDLDNFGTVTIADGYGNPGNRAFTNYGAVIVSLDVERAVGSRFVNYGYFFKVGNGQADLNGAGFTNAGGYVGLYEGRMVLAPRYVQTDGVTEMVDGTTLQATVDLQGGYLVGAGTILGNVTNGAWIEVGGFGATGILLIQGNYTQTAAGVLSLELGGTDPGAYDQLAVTGRATLDGSLVVSYLPDYAPDPGDAYRVLTFGTRQGDFASLFWPDGLSGSYDATGLTLRAE